MADADHQLRIVCDVKVDVRSRREAPASPIVMPEPSLVNELVVLTLFVPVLVECG